MDSRVVRSTDRVADHVANPDALRVFEVLGIDVCCSSGRTLATASEAVGLSFDEVSLLLSDDDATPLRSVPPGPDFDALPLALQIDHLVTSHHPYARRQLLRLDRMLRVVWSGHRKLANLIPIRTLVGELIDDLIPHMAREERYLFPYMRSLEGQMNPAERISVPLFGNLQYPLASITHDHGDDSERLLELRKLTGGFVAASDSCIRVITLFNALAELERDLQEHIRIENQIVFPKAVALEHDARMRATSAS